MSLNLCMLVSDVRSFNVLYRGQLEYLSKQEVSLTLICGGEENGFNKLKERRVGKIYNLGIVRRPNLISDIISFLKLFYHFLTHRYDIVVVTTPKAILLGSLASFLTFQRRRVVFFQGRVYENSRGLKKKIFLFLDKLSIICSQESIFVSESLKRKYIEDLPELANKFYLVGAGSGNGVSICKFNPSRYSAEENQKLRESLGFKEDDFIIITAGRIRPDKGILDVSRVAEKLRKYEDIKIIILGAIDDNESKSVLDEMLTSERIRHIGFAENIAAYMAMSDIHLFLTHREGFGNVAIEAAAMGLPTIAYDVVGVKDSVNHSVSGYRFPLGEIKSVTTAILKFYNDPEIKNNFQITSRRWAVDNFSDTAVWEKYYSFYNK